MTHEGFRVNSSLIGFEHYFMKLGSTKQMFNVNQGDLCKKIVFKQFSLEDKIIIFGGRCEWPNPINVCLF